jgi:hypothetical protein
LLDFRSPWRHRYAVGDQPILAWAVCTIEAETKKQLIQSLRPFYALISPTQAGFQSPLRVIGLRMWLIFSFTLMMDSI